MATKEKEELTGADIQSIPNLDLRKQSPDGEARENEKLKAKHYEQEQEIKRLTYLLEKAEEEKKKPGVQVVDENGEYLKKKRVNSSGLSDMVLPPYTKNQVAIYRIIGTEEINPATGLKVDPVDTLIPGSYIFHDPFEKDPLKKDKYMKNVIGTESYVEDGEAKVRQTIDDIVFLRGWLQVPVKDKYGLYIFMELHPNNKSNRYRASNAPMVFERVDIQNRSQTALNMTTDLALDAGMAVRKMTKDQVLSYCVTAVPPIHAAGRPIDEVRSDLVRYAMNNPVLFFQQNRDIKAAVAITAADAISFGLIDYRPQQKTYVNSETDEVIHTHTIQQDPTESLINFLSKEENKAVYQNIVDRLNYWNN